MVLCWGFKDSELVAHTTKPLIYFGQRAHNGLVLFDRIEGKSAHPKYLGSREELLLKGGQKQSVCSFQRAAKRTALVGISWLLKQSYIGSLVLYVVLSSYATMLGAYPMI